MRQLPKALALDYILCKTVPLHSTIKNNLITLGTHHIELQMKTHAKANQNKNKYLTPTQATTMELKVHKTTGKTRPIVSCAGSLLHPLGVWLDHYMQDIAKKMPSYLANSKELKEELITLNLLSGACLFTADTTS
eukprot:8887189-Ditylum_brightwellii.AAC.1